MRAGSPVALGRLRAEHIDETLKHNVKGLFHGQKALR